MEPTSQGRRSLRLIVGAAIIILLAFVSILVWKFVIHPSAQDNLIAQTSVKKTSSDEHAIRIATDSFKGYSVFRSDGFAGELRESGFSLELVDDGGDYAARQKALRKGDVDMAVITIDANLKTGAKLEQFPGTIVLAIDESAGADGMVAYKQALAAIEDLDHSTAHVVAMPDSPSETFVQVVRADMSLPQMPEDWFVPETSQERIYNLLRATSPTERKAFVLWEPYLSKSLKIPGVHRLLDTSQVRGIIVDVLLARREFLRDHPEQVKVVLAAYLRTLYSYQSRGDEGFAALLIEDGQKTGEIISSDEAHNMVKGIRFWNTTENYALFGLLPTGESAGLPTLHDTILNIGRMLTASGAFAAMPVADPSELYFDGVLRDLYSGGFHPRSKLGVVDVPKGDLGAVRVAETLPELSAEDWDKLSTVGHLRICAIEFRRASSALSLQGQRSVDEIARQLHSYPTFYLTVVGHARADGDQVENEKLALARAQSVSDQIISRGIPTHRIRVKAAPPVGMGGESQSVSFLLGQKSY
ncbi:MAG: OmpA family protein [Candidatus Uhrbacteria bacterium GW2011_GWE2_46_68]|uniref:OmpA family protein n=2 Tax=Candidatus Uhriibacteriota TaxID=1752732 RepID=A0A0G1Q7E3_9BACT|nr:MAG: OmpA family protein [Candidatus Uhrbacteria bacterium GW2011_GWF2_46_218]KKU40762.1 MAG: OmpA family protein [Candidatus Uhrbacteria bacterium GW2011_GWE2_46_68]